MRLTISPCLYVQTLRTKPLRRSGSIVRMDILYAGHAGPTHAPGNVCRWTSLPLTVPSMSASSIWRRISPPRTSPRPSSRHRTGASRTRTRTSSEQSTTLSQARWMATAPMHGRQSTLLPERLILSKRSVTNGRCAYRTSRRCSNRQARNTWGWWPEAWTHEQDIRGSLGLKGVGDTGGMHATLELLDRLGPHIDEAGLPGLRIVTSDQTWTLGSQAVGATLATTGYMAARLVFGRRSPEQVLALDWDGDPAPFLPVIGAYGLAATDIID